MRCRPGQALLVLALLPALLFGPALGGAAAWIHAHGHFGGHVHLLPHGHDHDAPTLAEWHDAQHRRAHERGHHDELVEHENHEEEEPAPEGLSIELPVLLASAPQGSTAARAASPQLQPHLPLARWHLTPVESFDRPELAHSGWPPPLRAMRSGVAALLRSSHAILI